MTAGLPPGTLAQGPKLSAWLLRPFLDLGPFVTGPLYARGIEEYWRAFVDPRVPRFSLQRTLPPVFRTQLVAESGRPEYLVGDPRELPKGLRTDRWSEVCGALANWPALAYERKRALLLLLHSLCLYEPVLKLVPEFNIRRIHDDPEALELAYWRASARYVLGAPSRLADYADADMSAFEAIAVNVPAAVPAALNAAIKVFVHKAKTGAAPAQIKKWRGHLDRVLADTARTLEPFAVHLLTSRYYRALAFLPQRRGDPAEVVRIMDLAERHARKMKPRTAAEELVRLENLHPVMESRTKEALWLGDRGLAHERALKVVKLDPYDSKAWVELGEVRMARKEWARAAEAYVAAAMLGPPASAIGRHMAGFCYRKCGQDMLAAFLFKDALEIDPLGISPHVEIRNLPDASAMKALKEWSIRAF